MSTAQQPKTRAETLIEFCKKIGIAATEAKEPSHSYNLLKIVGAEHLKAATKEHYEDLLAAFEKSLHLRVSRPINEVEGSEQLYIEFKDGKDASGVSEGIAEIHKLPDQLKLTLVISIDKAALVQILGLDETRYNCLIYLFKEKLSGLLDASLVELDQDLFPSTTEEPNGVHESERIPRDKPTVIVVSDADIHFSGDMLTIVGESILFREPELQGLLKGHLTNEDKGSATIAPEVARREDQTKPAGCLSRLRLQGLLGVKTSSLTSPSEEKKGLTPLSATLEQVHKYRTAALENPSLLGQQFKHLTPLHFLGQWKKGNDELKKKLARHFANICILYTANRSTFDDTGNPLESVYNSSDRTATLNLKDEAPDAISTMPLESLAKWFYSGKGTDQRTIFQNVIARELYSDSPKENYNSFITRMPQLLKDAVWQYQVFVDGKITKHFEELQKVIGYITDVNKKISEAIDAITKSLTDALLATVGVLVVSVLAALVKKETSVEIFEISMNIYALYLLFYAGYRMGSIGHSYRLLSQETGAQFDKYKAALRVDEIAELSLPLARRKRQFTIWFWLTVVFYLVLSALIYWAGKKGPPLLRERGIIPAASAPAERNR